MENETTAINIRNAIRNEYWHKKMIENRKYMNNVKCVIENQKKIDIKNVKENRIWHKITFLMENEMTAINTKNVIKN